MRVPGASGFLIVIPVEWVYGVCEGFRDEGLGLDESSGIWVSVVIVQVLGKHSIG